MSRLPNWARKPEHPKEVIATSRGWEVKYTGEILVSVRGLDEKLAEFVDEAEELKAVEVQKDDSESITKSPDVSEVEVEDVPTKVKPAEEPEPVEEPEEKVEEPKPKPKRRGRPPKKKTTDE